MIWFILTYVQLSKTFGGVVYFVTFINDHCRKVWVFILKYKDQLEVFKELHVKLERETRRLLKVVWLDSDGKYRGLFESYCKGHGIKLEKNPSKTPQHNGVVEKMNRIIEEMIKCMLSYAKLLKPFWVEAMRTAIDLINLSLKLLLIITFQTKFGLGNKSFIII